MDNEHPVTETPPHEPPATVTPVSPTDGRKPATLPRGAAFPGPSSTESTPLARVEAIDRNGVFGQLVKADGDIAGLVAYSIYKQNKLDWLTAFEAAKARVPNEMELSAYIIGEETPRRLSTYRHLAEATLAGHGPDSASGAPGRRGGAPSAFSPSLIAIYAIIAMLCLVGFWLAAHYTMTSR